MTSSMVMPSKLCIDRTDLGMMIGGRDKRIVLNFLVKLLEKSSAERGPVVNSDGCSREFILRQNDFESVQLLIPMDQKSL